MLVEMLGYGAWFRAVDLLEFVILERSEGSDSGEPFDHQILHCAPG